jgi:hypothetical protein
MTKDRWSSKWQVILTQADCSYASTAVSEARFTLGEAKGLLRVIGLQEEKGNSLVFPCSKDKPHLLSSGIDHKLSTCMSHAAACGLCGSKKVSNRSWDFMTSYSLPTVR